MVHQTETMNAPLEIYNFQKETAPHVTAYQQSLKAFRDEVVRIMTEECNIVFSSKYPPGEIEPAQEKRELKDAFEFRVVIKPELYGHAFDFIIKNDGSVSVELLTNSANHSNQVAWYFTFFWKIEGKSMNEKLLEKLHGFLPANEIYQLLPTILEYAQ